MTAPALRTYANAGTEVDGDNFNTFEQTCNLFNDLRAFTGTTGMQVFTRGRTSVNDGYGGEFYWDGTSAGTDDNLNIVAPTGATIGRWLRASTTTGQFAGLTADQTGGDVADSLPFLDASESGAANVVTVADFLKNGINTATVTASPSMANDLLLSLNAAAGAVRKVLMRYIGAGKQTIWIPAGSMYARTTNGAASGTVELATNKVMIKSLDFDPATIEYAQFEIQMPKGWNEGTFTAIFVWSHAATVTNFGVVWAIQALARSDNDPQDTAFGTAVSIVDTGGTTDNLYRSSEIAAMTPSGSPVEGDVVIFQVFRDATNGSDTMTIDARLQGVALFLTTDANTDD